MDVAQRDCVREIDGQAEALNEEEKHPLRVELCVAVAQCDIVKEIVGQAEAVYEEEKQLLAVKLSVAVALRDCDKDIDGQPEAVNEEEKHPLRVEHGVLDIEEVGQPLWVTLPDKEPQGLTVNEDEGERDCDGEAVKLWVEVAQRESVVEMDWQAEEVNEEEKQPLKVEQGVLDSVEDGQPLWVPVLDVELKRLAVNDDDGERDMEGEEVKLCVDVAQRDTVEDMDWQPEGVKEEEKQPLSVEQGVLDTDEDEQPLGVPLQDVELQGLTVNDEEVERDCEGEDVKLCVEVTQRVTVEEMDWQPEAEKEEEKQLLGV